MDEKYFYSILLILICMDSSYASDEETPFPFVSIIQDGRPVVVLYEENIAIDLKINSLPSRSSINPIRTKRRMLRV